MTISSVAQSCLTLQPYGLQHASLPYPSATPKACSDSCPSSRWCRPATSSSVVPFSSCPQSFPASQSFLMSQFFPSSGHSNGVSAWTSVLPVNIQDWSPLGLTGLISLQAKGLSGFFSNTSSKSSNSLSLSFLFFSSFLYSPTLISICNYWKNDSFDSRDLWLSSRCHNYRTTKILSADKPGDFYFL